MKLTVQAVRGTLLLMATSQGSGPAPKEAAQDRAGSGGGLSKRFEVKGVRKVVAGHLHLGAHFRHVCGVACFAHLHKVNHYMT